MHTLALIWGGKSGRFAPHGLVDLSQPPLRLLVRTYTKWSGGIKSYYAEFGATPVGNGGGVGIVGVLGVVEDEPGLEQSRHIFTNMTTNAKLLTRKQV